MIDPKLRFKAFDQPWEEKILGNLASTICGGGTPSKNNQEYWEGTLPWISSSDLSENNIQNINISRFITESAVKNSSTKKVTKGSVLIVSRVGVGKVAVAPYDLYTSQDFTNIIDPLCDSAFLGYFVSKLMQKKMISVQGSAIKGIPSDEIKKYSIYLPILEEQQKIAAFFTALDKKIEINKEILSRYRVIQKEFIDNSLGLVNVINLKKEYLENIVAFVKDYDHYMPPSVKDGVPYVMTSDFIGQDNKIDFEGCKKISFE